MSSQGTRLDMRELNNGYIGKSTIILRVDSSGVNSDITDKVVNGVDHKGRLVTDGSIVIENSHPDALYWIMGAIGNYNEEHLSPRSRIGHVTPRNGFKSLYERNRMRDHRAEWNHAKEDVVQPKKKDLLEHLYAAAILATDSIKKPSYIPVFNEQQPES